MLRTLTASALGLALAATAASQAAQPAVHTLIQPEKIPGTVKHAGIYHMATGRWTRSAGDSANFGPDTVYSNTATSGYYSPVGGPTSFAPGSTLFDSGVLPTSVNPNANANRDVYTVNCMSLSYCDFGAPGTSGWNLRFYDEYVPCTFEPLYQNELKVTGLPATGCWTVDLDLSGGLELCIAGDGGDGYQGDIEQDSFGWSFRYAGTDGTMPAGFVIAGDPRATEPSYVLGGLPTDGTNTYFGVPSQCGPDQATGFFNPDFWWLEDPAGTHSGCYFFQPPIQGSHCGPSSPQWASWFLELQADTGICDPFIIVPSGCTSNPNSSGFNGSIDGFGSTSVAQNNVTLRATVPANTVGFFITSPLDGFFPNPAGSAGNICLGSNVGRFQAAAQNSGATGLVTLSTLIGQWDLSSIPSALGPYAAVPGTPAYFQCWHRDTSPFGPTSNFTDGAVILWTP